MKNFSIGDKVYFITSLRISDQTIGLEVWSYYTPGSNEKNYLSGEGKIESFKKCGALLRVLDYKIHYSNYNDDASLTTTLVCVKGANLFETKDEMITALTRKFLG